MATSIRVGNELGAGNPSGARKVSFVAIGCTLCLCVPYMVFFLTTKDYIGILFVPGNKIVRKKIANLMYVICTYMYFDHVQIVIGGVFRGSGRQYIGAIMNFIGYYIIGLPLGITLALKLQWGILGLWIGMNFSCAFLCFTFIIILLRTNWKKQSEIAIQRARKDDEKVPTSSKTESANEEDKQKQFSAEFQNIMLNVQHEDEVTLLSDSAEEIPLNELQQTSDPNSIIEVETGMNSEAQNEEQAKTDEKVRNGAESGDSRQSRPTTLRSRGQVMRVLSRGSFFAIGLAILVAGGVASNYHPYYVDPEEYENCTTAQLNDSVYYS